MFNLQFISFLFAQLRLDFNTFVIDGPSSTTATSVVLLGGQPINTAANGVTAGIASQCVTDQFSVSNPTGRAPSVICGTNSGEHRRNLVQKISTS